MKRYVYFFIIFVFVLPLCKHILVLQIVSGSKTYTTFKNAAIYSLVVNTVLLLSSSHKYSVFEGVGWLPPPPLPSCVLMCR